MQIFNQILRYPFPALIFVFIFGEEIDITIKQRTLQCAYKFATILPHINIATVMIGPKNKRNLQTLNLRPPPIDLFIHGGSH